MDNRASSSPQAVASLTAAADAALALGDLEAAAAAVEAALRLDPRDFAALLRRAQLIERRGQATQAALAYGAALTHAPPDEALDAAAREALAHARAVYGRHLAGLEAALKAQIHRDLAVGSPAHARRAEAFAERIVGKRRVYHQAPMQFHYPGLAEVEFHDREDFPWLAGLEAATGDIREELIEILREDGEDLQPYVSFPDGARLGPWAELNRSPRWGAFHLIFDGREVVWNARRAPRTMAALARLPQPRVSGRSPTAVFSVLQPRTRIPPHTGVANTRLIVHLPLIAPEGCGFCVGAETRQWREGEAWVFDDTIEHEAWNDSDQPRAILICDVWNPALDEHERRAISGLMETMDRFNQAGPAAGEPSA